MADKELNIDAIKLKRKLSENFNRDFLNEDGSLNREKLFKAQEKQIKKQKQRRQQ